MKNNLSRLLQFSFLLIGISTASVIQANPFASRNSSKPWKFNLQIERKKILVYLLTNNS